MRDTKPNDVNMSSSQEAVYESSDDKVLKKLEEDKENINDQLRTASINNNPGLQFTLLNQLVQAQTKLAVKRKEVNGRNSLFAVSGSTTSQHDQDSITSHSAKPLLSNNHHNR